MPTQYTALKLTVPNDCDVTKLRYDIELKYIRHVQGTSEISKPVTNQVFNARGESKHHKITYASTKYLSKITYHIKVNGKLVKRITAKPKSSQGSFSTFILKTTPAGSKKDPNTIKEVIVKNTEVAWYLVKKEESMNSFLKRIYKQKPGPKEELIFLKNNPHLTGAPLLTLYPGDIVILSNTTEDNNELRTLKAHAKTAKDEIEQLKKQKNFDAKIFAYNADIMHDMLRHGAYVAITESPVKSADKPSDSINHAAVATGISDSIITFLDKSNEKVTGAYKEIVQAMEKEKAAGSRLANPKHFNEFKRKYAHLFRNYDNAFSQQFFKYETGTQTNNLRRQLNSSVAARPTNFKGGIDAYVKNFKNMGKITKATKVGGNVLLAMSIADAGVNVKSAYATGNSDLTRKTVIKETLKLEGSIAGGAGGAYLGGYAGVAIATVFGLSTGGVGFLVVAGVCAAGGGLAGGYFGGELGESKGEQLGDFVNKNF